MKLQSEGEVGLSASDLTAATQCEWAFVKKLEGLLGIGPVPPSVEDAMMTITSKLGLAHEQRVLEQLRDQYGDVAEISNPLVGDGDYFDRLRQSRDDTIKALRDRRRVIFQATFFDGEFQGFADFLVWHDEGFYEVVDTKLARSAKVTALMQLAAYADQLRKIEIPVGPEVSLWLGNGEVSVHQLADIEPVFRQRMSHLRGVVKERVVAAEAGGPASTWTEATYSYCASCEVCEEAIVAHDDLHQIADMRRDQRAKIMSAGFTTLERFADSSGDIPDLNPKTLDNLRAQARAQLKTRQQAADSEPYVVFDRPDGLAALPDPSAGDVFFDFEGDPLYDENGVSGLDYLFGWVGAEGAFEYIWADSLDEEKVALERFVDEVFALRDRYPGMHVYHYASYEQTHLLQLAQRHGTREEEVDELVRDHVLVNLLPIVKKSLRLGQPSYSIKYLEKVYLNPPRTGDTANAVDSVIDYHRYREALLVQDAESAEVVKRSILDYNDTDCVSTLQLYRWLLSHREVDYVAPAHRKEKGARTVEEEEDPVRDRLRALVSDIPYGDRTANERAIALAAEAVDYHRRENRTFWWSHFRRLSEPMQEWEDERGVVSISSVGILSDWEKKRTKAYREIEVRGTFAPGTVLKTGNTPFVLYEDQPAALIDPSNPHSRGCVDVEVVESGDGYLVLKEGARLDSGLWEDLPSAVVPPAPPRDFDIRGAIKKWASRLLLSLPDAMPDDPAMDILRRVAPRGVITYPDEATSSADAITASVLTLKDSYLAVQGPPGTGKTYNGAQVIANLVNRGWKVGVVAQSHAAVENLMRKCAESGISPNQMGKKLAQGQSVDFERPWTQLTTGEEIGDFVNRLGGLVLGGTTWTFCNEKVIAPKTLDLIVIEEAGQFSLANTIAVSEAAHRLLLLGDPQQLGEVSQGSHPEPIDRSALGWLSEGHDVLPPQLGIFLDTSYRMHPELCSVVSDLAYDGKLKAVNNPSRHLDGVAPGLHTRPIAHEGHSVESIEEATEVVHIVEELWSQSWTKDGESQPLRDWDKGIIVVAPYNAQVNVIRRELDRFGFSSIPVGTVDKFQGQEAAVAIVSMSASSLHDVPRGVDFLLSKNRLNVALSRAQWASYLVYSPALVDFMPGKPKDLALLSRFTQLVS
ncbi:MAG: TM0106 family RecB-like putative nuclease [Aquiluna sp.]